MGEPIPPEPDPINLEGWFLAFFGVYWNPTAQTHNATDPFWGITCGVETGQDIIDHLTIHENLNGNGVYSPVWQPVDYQPYETFTSLIGPFDTDLDAWLYAWANEIEVDEFLIPPEE